MNTGAGGTETHKTSTGHREQCQVTTPKHTNHLPDTDSTMLLRLHSTRDVTSRQLPLDKKRNLSAVDGTEAHVPCAKIVSVFPAVPTPRGKTNALTSNKTRIRRRKSTQTRNRPGVGDGVPVHEGTVPVLRQVSRNASHLHPVHRARGRQEPHEHLSVGRRRRSSGGKPSCDKYWQAKWRCGSPPWSTAGFDRRNES